MSKADQKTRLLNKIIRQYGKAYTVNAGEDSYTAMVSPLRYQNKLYIDGVKTPLGHDDKNYWLFIGEASIPAPFEKGDILHFSSDSFWVKAVQIQEFENSPFYCWAILDKLLPDTDPIL